MKGSVVKVSVSIAAFLTGSLFVGLVSVKKKESPQISVQTVVEETVSPPAIVKETSADKSLNEEFTNLSLNPYTIHRFVKDREKLPIYKLWERLSISTSLDRTRGEDSGFYTTPEPFDECSYCKSELFEVELDGKKGKEVLVRIEDSWDACRFLVFRKEERDWKLLGYIDSNFKTHGTSHEVLRFGDRIFLLIEQIETTGTGISEDIHRLFEIKGDSLVETLNFLSRRIYDGGGSREEIYTRVVGYSNKNGNETVTLNRKTSLWGYCYSFNPDDYSPEKEDCQEGDEENGGFPVLKSKKKVVFKKDKLTNKFVFNEDSSEVGELELLSSIERTQEEYKAIDISFTKSFFKELMQTARGKQQWSKKWLKNFLSATEDTPEKIKLLKALS